MNNYNIAIIPFDGASSALLNMTAEVLNAVQKRINKFRLDLTWYDAGTEYFDRSGKLMPDGLMSNLKTSDALLCGNPGVSNVHKELTDDSAKQKRAIEFILRKELKNGIAVRPYFQFKGIKSPLVDQENMDVLLVYQLREEAQPGQFNADGFAAYDMQIVTRPAVEKMVRYAFQACQGRNGRLLDGQRTITTGGKQGVVECLDFIRKITAEMSGEFLDIMVDFKQIDALAEHFIKANQKLDVLICEGQHGLIIEKMGYYLAGSTEMSPSADIGGITPIFRSKHGPCTLESNKNIINPFGMILSAALMVSTLGNENNDLGLREAGKLIVDSIQGSILRNGPLTADIGGSEGTTKAFESVLNEISH